MGINIKDNKNIKNDKELSYEILKSLNIDDNDVNNEEIKSSEVKVKNKKRLFLRKELIYLLLIIFLVFGAYSGINLIKWSMDAKNTEKQINEINTSTEVKEVNDTIDTVIVNPPKEENKENPYWDYIKMNLINVNFKDLKKINNDTVGWIQVNGTNINYPYVQTNDNTYYLKKDFNKKYNSAGWVFMDYRNNISNFDKNTILYAHGRVDGTMFGSLKNITKSNWYNDKSNHVVKLSTEYENTLWQVFSVYHIKTENYYITTDFRDDDEFKTFIDTISKRSKLKFDASVDVNDTILTLSTCRAGDEKVVLHAKLIKKEVRN